MSILLNCLLLNNLLINAAPTDYKGLHLFQTVRENKGREFRKHSILANLYWGDQRMGLLRFRTIESSGKLKNLFEGIRSWQWCAFVSLGNKSYIIASGYWDVSSHATRIAFQVVDGKLLPKKHISSPTFRALIIACNHYADNRKRFPFIEAHLLHGRWTLKNLPYI